MKRPVFGHIVGMKIYDFPHVCPGEGCAVERWLTRKHWMALAFEWPAADARAERWTEPVRRVEG